MKGESVLSIGFDPSGSACLPSMFSVNIEFYAPRYSMDVSVVARGKVRLIWKSSGPAWCLFQPTT